MFFSLKFKSQKSYYISWLNQCCVSYSEQISLFFSYVTHFVIEIEEDLSEIVLVLYLGEIHNEEQFIFRVFALIFYFIFSPRSYYLLHFHVCDFAKVSIGITNQIPYQINKRPARDGNSLFNLQQLFYYTVCLQCFIKRTTVVFGTCEEEQIS